MEILNQFGFDIKLFLAQIVNFLIIAYVFKRFLYKPILDTLNKRNTTIKKGLKDAEEATLALENAQAQKDELLSKAGKEADRLLEEGKSQAQAARDELMEQTKKEIAKMMEQTRDQIILERENFKKEAKDISLEISKQILQTAISDLFDKKDQDALIKRGVQKIKNDKSTKN